ncbi:uncharacterized protein LOC122629409 [Vespula pensylvanica]|uniref:uncharacterized protein LOC122629409 n=1 Tax=Vespula pensylvanica TaxID=30213 RepID=UPI001CBA1799|nr:uncharacterized protein LOC122629409 [Vespula pensylvanica]
MKSSDFYREGDYKEYYKVLRFFMRICGLWPYQSFFAKYFFITMTIFLSEGILVGQLIEVIQIRTDLNEVIDCIPNILISLIVGIEFIGLVFNSGKLKKCIDRIVEDWQHLSSNVEIELLKSFTVQGRKLAFVYLFYMSLTGFMFMLQPIVLSFNSDNSTNIISTIPYKLEHLGDEGRLDVDLNIKKVDDNNYRIALDCLRKHIKVIELIFRVHRWIILG